MTLILYLKQLLLKDYYIFIGISYKVFLTVKIMEHLLVSNLSTSTMLTPCFEVYSKSKRNFLRCTDPFTGPLRL